MMKRISLFLVIAILMTVILPSVSFAATHSGCTVADNEYYYENFDGYTGEKGWFNTKSTNGYYSTADEF